MTEVRTPDIFDLLETLASSLKFHGHNQLSKDIQAGYARGTGGVDKNWIAGKICQAALAKRNIGPDRERAFDLINGERDYQANRWNEDTTASENSHTPTEWLVYIQNYLNIAMVAASTQGELEANEAVMDNLRKIGAMCIAAMEQNRTPAR